METETLKKIMKILEKTQDGVSLAKIQTAHSELVACEPLISKREKRTTHKGKKIKLGELEYDYSTYDSNRRTIEAGLKAATPFLTGEYTLNIPRNPIEVMQELVTFLALRGYAETDIKTVIELINIYGKNLSWRSEDKKIKELKVALSEKTGIKPTHSFTTLIIPSK